MCNSTLKYDSARSALHTFFYCACAVMKTIIARRTYSPNVLRHVLGWAEGDVVREQASNDVVGERTNTSLTGPAIEYRKEVPFRSD